MAIPKGYKHSEEAKKKIGLAARGRIASLKTREKIALSKIGNTNGFKKGEKKPPRTLEHRLRLSESLLGRKTWNKGKKNPERSGMAHHNWKGGITPINQQIRQSLEMKEWRRNVFERDDYRCFDCGARNGELGKTIKLEAHHLYPFALYPRIRFSIENGITLCKDCHNKTKKIYFELAKGQQLPVTS